MPYQRAPFSVRPFLNITPDKGGALGSAQSGVDSVRHTEISTRARTWPLYEVSSAPPRPCRRQAGSVFNYRRNTCRKPAFTRLVPTNRSAWATPELLSAVESTFISASGECLCAITRQALGCWLRWAACSPSVLRWFLLPALTKSRHCRRGRGLPPRPGAIPVPPPDCHPAWWCRVEAVDSLVASMVGSIQTGTSTFKRLNSHHLGRLTKALCAAANSQFLEASRTNSRTMKASPARRISPHLSSSSTTHSLPAPRMKARPPAFSSHSPL